LTRRTLLDYSLERILRRTICARAKRKRLLDDWITFEHVDFTFIVADKDDVTARVAIKGERHAFDLQLVRHRANHGIQRENLSHPGPDKDNIVVRRVVHDACKFRVHLDFALQRQRHG
jgi:hypothetical protein